MRLLEQIAHHRGMMKDDAHIERLVSGQPPTSLDLNTGVLNQEPAAAIGMTVSGRMLKYVGHPEGMGADFPWSKAWWLLRVECRRHHRHHRGQVFMRRDGREVDLWNGSLCHELVRFVIRRRFSVHNASKILLYNDPLPVLRSALDFIEERMDDFRRQQERRAKEDEGTALTCICGHPWSRHDDPSTVFRCAACSCSRYNADAA